MGATHITDHRAAALARLAQQLKGKTNLELFMGTFANRYQGVEDALWQLYTERWLETALGQQLDVLGRIIGQPRGNSANDEAYRLRLRARQRANHSSGTIEQLIAVFVALGIPVADLWFEPQFPAQLTLHIQNTVIDDATLYAEFLEDSRLGAVRALLHTTQKAASRTFTLASSSRLADTFTKVSGVYQTSIKLTSTATFPAAGSVLLRYGISGEQKRFSYTSKTASSFDGVIEREGTDDEYVAGELIVGVPQPEGELRSSFEGEPFPATMPLKDTTAFPSSGFVTLGYGADYRIFRYTSKTDTTLAGVTATDVGAGVIFAADELVVGCSRCLGANDEVGVGGFLSTIREA